MSWLSVTSWLDPILDWSAPVFCPSERSSALSQKANVQNLLGSGPFTVFVPVESLDNQNAVSAASLRVPYELIQAHLQSGPGHLLHDDALNG